MISIRHASQMLSTVLLNGYFGALSTAKIYQGPGKSLCLPVLSCHACPTAITACPVGTVQHHAAIHQAPLFIVGLFGLLGLMVGRMACGWICPFGLLQDLMFRLRTREVHLPRLLFTTRYFVLALLVILVPYYSGQHAFSILCPLGTLSAAIPWTIWNPVDPLTRQALIAAGTLGGLFVIKLAILGLFLWLFVVARRPFCRIVCPVGLFFSFFNRISLLRLQVSDGCNSCGKCAESCPMGIRIFEDQDSGDCIRCLACTRCPHVTVKVRGAQGPGHLPLRGTGEHDVR